MSGGGGGGIILSTIKNFRDTVSHSFLCVCVLYFFFLIFFLLCYGFQLICVGSNLPKCRNLTGNHAYLG